MKKINEKKLIGVLGGMGPLATCDFYKLLIELVPAKRDQEHARVVIMSDPAIPDRTEAILKNGKDPLPYMIDLARKLENIGAEFIVIPCNTAHFFATQIRSAINIPMISIIDATLKEVKERGFETSLLFATDATVSTGLYQKHAEKWGIEIHIPEKTQQKLIMQAIRYVKAGDIPKAKEVTKEVIELISKTHHIDCVIGGCTEVPLMWDPSFGIEFINSSEALARAALLYAFGEKIDERLFVRVD